MLFKLCFHEKVYLPNLHMNRYVVPSSISIRFFCRFINTGFINDSPMKKYLQELCNFSYFTHHGKEQVSW